MRGIGLLSRRQRVLSWIGLLSLAAQAPLAAKLLPDARQAEIADGVVSRPDLTAGLVRRATGAPEPESRIEE